MNDSIERLKILISRLESAINTKDAYTSLFLCGGLDQQLEWLIKDIKDWADHETKPNKNVS